MIRELVSTKSSLINVLNKFEKSNATIELELSLDMLEVLGTQLSSLNSILSYIGDYYLSRDPLNNLLRELETIKRSLNNIFTKFEEPETITLGTSKTISTIIDATTNILNNLYSGPGDPNDIINRDSLINFISNITFYPNISVKFNESIAKYSESISNGLKFENIDKLNTENLFEI
ncbi:7687_t:CDS:1, partial [Dentiscutata erythropus]